MSTVITTALQQERKISKNLQDNLAKSSEAGSHNIEANISYSQSGGVLKSSLTFARDADEFLDASVRSATSAASLDSVIYSSLRGIQDFLGGENPQDSKLVTSVNEFISKCNSLKVDSSLPAKQVFVDKAQRLTDAVNTASKQIISRRIATDQDLSKAVSDSNQILKNIFNLNLQIEGLKRQDAIKLHDERDRNISSLAELFKMDVRFTEKGAALISTDGLGLVVSTDEYIQLSYHTIISEIRPLAINNAINPITVIRYNGHHQQINNAQAVEAREERSKIDFSYPVNYGKKDHLKGGKIEGLLQLRDNILINTYQLIQKFGNTVASRVNEIHNNGSGWPPRSNMISSDLVRESDPVKCSGDVSFFLVDEFGQPLEGHSGFLSRSVINIENVPSNYSFGKPTYGELAREISELLSSPSSPRAGLGEIYSDKGLGGDAIPLNTEYLLNNIQIAARSNIVNGEMSFDFELQGNSHFGSNVEILSITGPDGALSSEIAHQMIRLEKDIKQRFGNEYKITGLTGLVDKEIEVKIRVSGDNGILKEGTIKFILDPTDTTMINRRIAFSGDNTKLSGGFIGLAASHNSIAKSEIVNSNNVQLSYGSSGYGYMHINSGSPKYRIVVQGGNFAQSIGLNNFFNYNMAEGTLNVREDILEDATKVSTGRISESEGRVVRTKIGSKKASTALTFAGVPDATSIITVDGVNLVFNNPASAGEVQIVPGDINATLDVFVNSINEHADLKNKFVASRVDQTITIVSKLPGTWGNASLISGTIVGGGTIDINSGGAAAIYADTLFTGGEDVNSEITVYKYFISEKSSEILDDLTDLKDLHHLASITTSLFSNHVNDAEKNSKVKIKSLEILDQVNKENSGIVREEQYMKLMESISNQKMFASMLKKEVEAMENLQNILAAI